MTTTRERLKIALADAYVANYAITECDEDDHEGILKAHDKAKKAWALVWALNEEAEKEREHEKTD